MNPARSARVYARYARELSRHWDRPLHVTAAKLVLSRILFGRGPREFDGFGFTTKPLREWRSYVVERERRRRQREFTPGALRDLDQDKVAFWRACRAAGLPTPPITAVIAPPAGATTDLEIPVARTGAELREIIEPLADFAGFAKPLAGGLGYGAFTFDAHGGSATVGSSELSAEALFDRCRSVKVGGGGYLLQPRLKTHDALSPIMPGPGLGTFRLVTFLNSDGVVETPWAVLKIPARGQVVCHPRLGAIMAPVDFATGRIGRAVGPTSGTRIVDEIEQNPETGVRIEGVQVPGWDEIVSLVERAARAFDRIPCLGWDVAVTDRGPMLLESNWGFGITGQQMVLDRGLRLELDRQFSRCARGDG